MTRGHYLKLVAVPLLLLALLPVLYSVALMTSGGEFFGFPVALIQGILLLAIVGGLLGLVLGVLALAVWQPSYFRCLLVGLGLPVLIVLIARWTNREAASYAALVPPLLSPALMGAAALYERNARPWLRWNAAIVTATLLPVVFWLPEWAMPSWWVLSKGMLAVALVVIGILTALLHAALPENGQASGRWWPPMAVSVLLFALMTGAVAWLPARVLDARVEAAVATFKERHPDVPVRAPKVEPASGRTLVKLPSDGWTFELTIENGRLTDDGYTQREVARVTEAWLKQRGLLYEPIESGHVSTFDYGGSVQLPGGWHARVNVTSPKAELLALTIYRGRVVDVLTSYQHVVTAGPLTRQQVVDLYTAYSGAKLKEPIYPNDIQWAWDRGDGTWEYGVEEGYQNYGYVVIRGETVLQVVRALPYESWPPPHK